MRVACQYCYELVYLKGKDYERIASGYHFNI